MSLIPFATGWWGENHFAPLPTAVYGVVLLACAVGYWILTTAIVSHQGESSKLREAMGSDIKGKLSLVLYASAVPLAFVNEAISAAIYVTVALIWFVPDRRIEGKLGH
jgi:uncharacterized membrane protein